MVNFTQIVVEIWDKTSAEVVDFQATATLTDQRLSQCFENAEFGSSYLQVWLE